MTIFPVCLVKNPPQAQRLDLLLLVTGICVRNFILQVVTLLKLFVSHYALQVC